MKNIIRIGIDGNEANVSQLVGVSVYLLKLLEYFRSKASHELQFIIYLKNQPQPHLPGANEFFKYQVVWGPTLWRDVFFPLHLYMETIVGRARRIDILFAPAHYSPRFCPVPTVVTIHDLAYEYFPDDFLAKDIYKLTNWTRQSVARAARIIAVSQSTRDDVVKLYHPKAEVNVIHNGVGTVDDDQQNAGALSQLTIDLANQKYLLYIGTLQKRKNLPVLVKAFSQLKKHYPDLKLIIAGKKGWLYEDLYLTIQELRLENDVICPGYIDESTKEWLYRHAEAFVMPSLYEGCCLPVLEAMHYHCPVVALDSSSLSEICAEACQLFNGEQEHATMKCAEAIRHVLDNANVRKSMIAAGDKRVKDFSWEKSAKATLDILIQQTKS